jgi:hypothetical protein
MESKIWKYLAAAWLMLSFYTFRLYVENKEKCSEGQCNHINSRTETTIVKEKETTIGKIDSTYCLLCNKFIGFEKIIIR